MAAYRRTLAIGLSERNSLSAVGWSGEAEAKNLAREDATAIALDLGLVAQPVELKASLSLNWLGDLPEPDRDTR